MLISRKNMKPNTPPRWGFKGQFSLASFSLSLASYERAASAGRPCQPVKYTPPPPPVWAGAQLSLVVAAGVTAVFCCWCLPRGKYLQHNEACLSLRYSTEKCAQGIPGL